MTLTFRSTFLIAVSARGYKGNFEEEHWVITKSEDENVQSRLLSAANVPMRQQGLSVLKHPQDLGFLLQCFIISCQWSRQKRR